MEGVSGVVELEEVIAREDEKKRIGIGARDKVMGLIRDIKKEVERKEVYVGYL